MEDAMILNKSSFERGFAHGTVIKCEVCITATLHYCLIAAPARTCRNLHFL